MNTKIEICRYPWLRNQDAPKLLVITNRLQQSSDNQNQINKEVYEHGSYGSLLFDIRWKQKRTIILNRDNNQCVICSERENLQVHHRQYHFVSSINQFKPPWDYDNELLITLCKNCHNRGHSKFKVPTLTI